MFKGVYGIVNDFFFVKFSKKNQKFSQLVRGRAIVDAFGFEIVEFSNFFSFATNFTRRALFQVYNSVCAFYA